MRSWHGKKNHWDKSNKTAIKKKTAVMSLEPFGDQTSLDLCVCVIKPSIVKSRQVCVRGLKLPIYHKRVFTIFTIMWHTLHLDTEKKLDMLSVFIEVRTKNGCSESPVVHYCARKRHSLQLQCLHHLYSTNGVFIPEKYRPRSEPRFLFVSLETFGPGCGLVLVSRYKLGRELKNFVRDTFSYHHGPTPSITRSKCRQMRQKTSLSFWNITSSEV